MHLNTDVKGKCDAGVAGLTDHAVLTVQRLLTGKSSFDSDKKRLKGLAHEDMLSVKELLRTLAK